LNPEAALGLVSLGCYPHGRRFVREAAASSGAASV
jgi:hypothetical protein